LFIDDPDVKDLILGSTDEQGLRIANSAQFVRWAARLGERLNPTASLTLPGGESGVQGAEARLAELKGMMGTEAWYKDPKLGSEYEDLITRLSAVRK
jgi:hypothetical protein